MILSVPSQTIRCGPLFALTANALNDVRSKVLGRPPFKTLPPLFSPFFF